jgi:hypothetical protein
MKRRRIDIIPNRQQDAYYVHSELISESMQTDAESNSAWMFFDHLVRG